MRLRVSWVGRKVEDLRCLKKACEAADPRDKCHQVPRVQNRVAGQRKMIRVWGCLYSQQNRLVQRTVGTHKSDEPVSNITWNS